MYLLNKILVITCSILFSQNYVSGQSNITVNVRDNDGWGDGRVYYMKWNQEAREYKNLTNKGLYNGKSSVELAPGLYSIQVKYTETYPDQSKSIKDISISANDSKSYDFYFNKGKIYVTVTDNDGWGDGRVYYMKWDEEAREFKNITNKGLYNGKSSVELAPGLYSIKVKYTETYPDQWNSITNIEIYDKLEKPFKFYFKKGEMSVTVTDNDGWGDGRVYYEKWNDEAREFKNITNKGLYNGKSSIELAPGLYSIQVKYTETYPDQWKKMENIEITDKQITPFKFYFEKGNVDIVVTDNNGWGDGRVYYSKWDDEKEEFKNLTNKGLYNGKNLIELAPGLYSIKVKYTESSPYQWKTSSNIKIIDNVFQSYLFEFGSSEHSPPMIRFSGPEENNNINGILEINEILQVKISLKDKDFKNAKLYLNDDPVKDYYNAGDYAYEFSPKTIGEYKIKLIAFDQKQPSNVYSYSKKFVINKKSSKAPFSQSSNQTAQSDKPGINIDKSQSEVTVKEESTDKLLEDITFYIGSDIIKRASEKTISFVVEKIVEKTIDKSVEESSRLLTAHIIGQSAGMAGGWIIGFLLSVPSVGSGAKLDLVTDPTPDFWGNVYIFPGEYVNLTINLYTGDRTGNLSMRINKIDSNQQSSLVKEVKFDNIEQINQGFVNMCIDKIKVRFDKPGTYQIQTFFPGGELRTSLNIIVQYGA